MTESNCGAGKRNTACSFRADTKNFGNNANFSSDNKTRPSVKRNKYIYIDHDKSLAEINKDIPSDLH